MGGLVPIGVVKSGDLAWQGSTKQCLRERRNQTGFQARLASGVSRYPALPIHYVSPDTTAEGAVGLPAI